MAHSLAELRPRFQRKPATRTPMQRDDIFHGDYSPASQATVGGENRERANVGLQCAASRAPGVAAVDAKFLATARSIKPSPRGHRAEFPVTGYRPVEPRHGGHTRLDTGTHVSLQEARRFIAVPAQRPGLKLPCTEEIT